MSGFARRGSVNAGDRLIADAGVTCIGPGDELLVEAGAKGGLFVRCDEGQHYLAGQLSDDETHYVGFYPARPAEQSEARGGTLS